MRIFHRKSEQSVYAFRIEIIYYNRASLWPCFCISVANRLNLVYNKIHILNEMQVMIMKFNDIGNGMVECFAVIKQCDVKAARTGSTYLDLLLSDKEGEIFAKIWDYTPSPSNKLEPDMLVKVRGKLQKYRDNDQLIIDRIRPAAPEDNVSLDDYVKSANYKGEDMFDCIVKKVSDFKDQDLKTLVLYLLNENREKLVCFPAAFKLHHAIRGGLMMHTLSIVKLCEAVCGVYPFVNRELLISGAVLHDIAKTVEFEISGTGLASGYTVEGNLIGHLVKGAMMIAKAAEKLGTDAEKSLLLQHMVISHHGEPEFGAAVRPLFLEAELLSELDGMDATVYEIMDATSGVAKGGFTGRLWALDDRKFYRHNDASLEVNLL